MTTMAEWLFRLRTMQRSTLADLTPVEAGQLGDHLEALMQAVERMQTVTMSPAEGMSQALPTVEAQAAGSLRTWDYGGSKDWAVDVLAVVVGPDARPTPPVRVIRATLPPAPEPKAVP